MSVKELSREARMYLECAMNCDDVYELQEKYFPKCSLTDLREGLEFVAFNEDEFGELKSFLEGINYQKSKKEGEKP